MPIEINELVIRATISENGPDTTKKPLSDDSKKLQQILDEVVKKINTKNER